MNVSVPVIAVVFLGTLAMIGARATNVVAPGAATKGTRSQPPTKGAQSQLPTNGHPAGGGKGASTVNGTAVGPRH